DRAPASERQHERSDGKETRETPRGEREERRGAAGCGDERGRAASAQRTRPAHARR
ncbi:hypothetical protein M9458_053767, partial [Cirrhinus mrigala]